MDTMSENRTFQDKFMLRLPDGMRERIKAEADKAGRSMNAEIVYQLENAYAHADLDAAQSELTNELRQRFDSLPAEERERQLAWLKSVPPLSPDAPNSIDRILQTVEALRDEVADLKKELKGRG